MPEQVTLKETDMEDFKIKFDSETHQINANTLISSLLHFTNITQEVNRELGTNKKIEIKINALRESSFLVHIFIEASILEDIKNLFTHANMSVVREIIVAVGGIFKVAKFLKGSAPKQITSIDGSTQITNNTGDITIIDNRVFHIYQNNKIVRDSVAREFETLENDPSVTGFELLDKEDSPIVEISKEEFYSLSSGDELAFIPANERVLTETDVLTISTISFDLKIKWSFYYRGNKISAKMSDDAFAKEIDGGEKFAKGDSLEVDFEITQEFDEAANVYINKSYKIIRIIRHLPRSEQSKLDFPS